MASNFFKKVIGKGIAKQMVTEHKKLKRKVKSNSGVGLKPDTQSVWISRANIEDFFKNENIAADGLRIYFGVAGYYKDGNEEVDCKDECRNQTNLIFVPTISSDPANPTMNNSGNYIDKNNNAKLAVLGGGRIEDDFELCPPSTSGCVEII